jgi:hypothetical protein
LLAAGDDAGCMNRIAVLLRPPKPESKPEPKPEPGPAAPADPDRSG